MELIDVAIGSCPCPKLADGSVRHPEGDTVSLYGEPTMEVGIAGQVAFNKYGTTTVDGLRHVLMAFVHTGIAAWTFATDLGPVPISRESVDWPETVARWLPWNNGGSEVALKVEALYTEAVFNPLLDRLSKLSQGGQTADLTPVTLTSGSNRRTRRARSSRTRSGGKQ